MLKFNRRDWLKSTGILGASTLLPGIGLSGSLSNTLNLPENGMIRLSSNENPYGPSEKVRKAMIETFDEGCRYPWNETLSQLHQKIADKEGVTKDHIVITGGSTEGLKITGAFYGMNGGEIIAPQPTFLSMMDHAGNFGSTTDWVGVNSDMSLDLNKITDQIDPKTKLIFLCNPNNPTSTLIPKADLLSFVSKTCEKVTVFSDEAYYDFIDDTTYPSMVKFAKEGKDVIVSRTFSKAYGLAGLRIGYLIAKPSIAKELNKRVVAFTNVLAIKAALVALDDQKFYDFSITKTKECKTKIYQTLDKIGLEYADSQTNFVFFHSGKDIKDMQKHFMSKNIAIGRPFPPFTDWCRISTGKTDEVDAFCDELVKYYS